MESLVYVRFYLFVSSLNEAPSIVNLARMYDLRPDLYVIRPEEEDNTIRVTYGFYGSADDIVKLLNDKKVVSHRKR